MCGIDLGQLIAFRAVAIPDVFEICNSICVNQCRYTVLKDTVDTSECIGTNSGIYHKNSEWKTPARFDCLQV